MVQAIVHAHGRSKIRNKGNGITAGKVADDFRCPLASARGSKIIGVVLQIKNGALTDAVVRSKVLFVVGIHVVLMIWAVWLHWLIWLGRILPCACALG